MYHVSAQGVDERMINVYYYYINILILIMNCIMKFVNCLMLWLKTPCSPNFPCLGEAFQLVFPNCPRFLKTVRTLIVAGMSRSEQNGASRI